MLQPPQAVLQGPHVVPHLPKTNGPFFRSVASFENSFQRSWVIVGGESGPRARPMLESWALDVPRQCREVGVPFFFKQWGARSKRKAGRHLKGRTWDEMPVLQPEVARRA